VPVAVAKAVGLEAIKTGNAKLNVDAKFLEENARNFI